MFERYFRGKRVLITGHTGFKGGWLALWLKDLGASVIGLALPAQESPNLYETIRRGTFEKEFWVDIRRQEEVELAVRKARPDFVFHLAAQSLVRRSYVSPVETMETNVIGTVNLLEALHRLSVRADMIVVTSDKCYANFGHTTKNTPYKEADTLGGSDPYSVSKAACELVVDGWRRTFFRPNNNLGNIATARAGNVIGGGDYAVDRIVPDCVRDLQEGRAVRVRNPNATRPWQHVLDCVSGYLWLGAKLGTSPKDSNHATAFNFGPSSETSHTVKEVVEEFLKHWPGKWARVIDRRAPPEAGELRLSTKKAGDQLKWRSTWGFADAVKNTAAWYRRRHEQGTKGLRAFSLGQIAHFCQAGRKQGQAWATPGSSSS